MIYVSKTDSEMVCVRLEGEDLEALEASIAEERLSRSDVIRRAIRAYAVKLGVLPKPKRK